MRPRKAPPRHQTLRELRTAALARWEDEDTISSIAERLERPERDVAWALKPTIERVISEYGTNCTVAQLADDFGVRESFVRYCIRSFYAGVRAR